MLLEIRRTNYDEILRVCLGQSTVGIMDVNSICGHDEKITVSEVGAAIGRMKSS